MSSRVRRPASGSTAPRRPRSNGASKKPRDLGTASAHDASEEPGLIVRADPLRARVDGLTKEHDRLLREIAKKRAHLEAAERLSHELFATLLSRTTPLREQLRQALQDIQSLFDALLSADSALNRRDKTKVRRIYQDLVEDLALPEFEEEEEFDFEFESDAEAEAEPKRAGKGRPNARESKHADFGLGGYSAHKPAEANHPSLRALFKRLAIAFHPDKVQDEQAKAERTSLMKDVTKAYESGDLARLMELERALLSRLPVGDEPDALQRRAKELVAANTELRRQQRSLTAALKELTLELPFDVNLKAADAKQRALREVDTLVSDLEQEGRRIGALRDFVRDFAEGRMTIADFLAGPRLPDDPTSGGDAALGDDLILDLIEDLLQASARPTRARGSGRSSGRRHRA